MAAAITVEDTEWGKAELPSYSQNVTTDQASTIIEEEDIDVAIIGGGLAGLAVAIGLRRAKINCKVYERAPRIRSTSQGILAIQPNGMKALESIHPDLPAMIVKRGCERHQLVHTTIKADGSIIEIIKESGKESIEKFGRAKVGLTWHNMQQVLASLLPPATIETSRSLVSFAETENGIVLQFDDHYHHSTTSTSTSTSTSSSKPIRRKIRAKAAIACDGVFSVARQQMFQDNNKNQNEEDDDCPIYFGQLNWATVIETNKLPPNVHPPNAVHYFVHEGEPRWMSMLNDGGAGQTFWQLRVVDPDMALSLSQNKGRGGLGLRGVKDALLPVAKFSQVVYDAIKCIPESHIFERAIVGRLPARTWLSANGRFALVGDSAHGMHPNIAQGANSSFESAAVVVHALVEAAANESSENQGDHVIDWAGALKKYEQRRKPKADIVQRFANMMGCYQATGETAIPKDVLPKIVDWIVGEDPKNYPSLETLDTICAFDPCSQPGVSKIQ